MATDFTGHVLRGARVSPANKETTAEPVTGVVRDLRPVPTAFDLDAAAPAVVDAQADQYRAAVLEAPGTSTTEYLLWAQNTSQLAMVDDATWWSESGQGVGSPGALTVTDSSPIPFDPAVGMPLHWGTFLDGSSRIIVTDDGNRSIGQILSIVIARGDEDDYDDDDWKDEEDIDPANHAGQARDGSNPYVQLFPILAADQDADAGIVNLTASQLTQLGGGFSVERGDRVVVVRYTVAAPRFWWTRNDRYENRFGWRNDSQRWEPWRGGSPKNIGRLLFDEQYELKPRITNLPIGAYLPGDASTPDVYAMLRLGTDPGALATPVGADTAAGFLGIRVKPNDEVENGFDFAKDPGVAGVVGQTNGILVFNPLYVALHAGKAIWYSFKGFEEDGDGVVGELKGSDLNPLYLAPIPGPTDYPFVRLGTRRHMRPTLVADDAALSAATPPLEGEVVISSSTGRLRLPQTEVDKADPAKTATFSKHYLGENVFYDGVALNSVAQPTRQPVQCVDSGGTPTVVSGGVDLFIPDATYLPTEFAANDPFRGLGQSGIIDAPDGTGATPLVGVASVRPGGDTLLDPNRGKVRSVSDGVGDTILFSKKGAIKLIEEERTEGDLPTFNFTISEGTAHVARARGAAGSLIALGSDDRDRFSGDFLYFLQSTLTPAMNTTEARIYSKSRDIFRFPLGTETLYFAIDGTAYTWTPAALIAANPEDSFFTPLQVAASIDAVITGTGRAFDQNGRVVLEAGTPTTGSIEIGFGAAQTKDLTGAAVLGFLPGWRVVGGVTNWLPDAGLGFGLFRSPINEDRSKATADVNARDRVSDQIVNKDVQGTPFQFLDAPPIQDVAGIDEGVFFNLINVIQQGETVSLVNKPLRHFTDIIHRFGQRRFDWAERNTVTGTVDHPLNTIGLPDSSVVPESMLAAPGIGGGFFSATTGGAFSLLDQENDYVLPENGTTGSVVLVSRYGKRITFGAKGTFVGGGTTFTDDTVDFADPLKEVMVGHKLQMTSGPGKGFYEVASIAASPTTTLELDPPFLASSTRPVPWETYDGFTKDVFDPGVVADQVFKEFNHIATEPFQARILSPLGDTPADKTVQSAARLRANMAQALTSKRPFEIRFGLTAATAANTATLTALTQTNLGVLANNVLVVPDSTRFTPQEFTLRVGAQVFTHGSDLTAVATFSSDPGGGTGVEYASAATIDTNGRVIPKGELRFGSQLLIDLASSKVWYVEGFQDPDSLVAGTAEYEPNKGDVNLSTADMTTWGTTTPVTKVYFVERQITEQRQDVAVSPLIGAFAFHHPIQTNQSVEVEYFAADIEGRKQGNAIIEFLPVFIRDEPCVRVTQNVYTFNAALRTVDQRIEPTVHIGPMMQNFGGTDYVTEYMPDGTGQITFVSKVVRSDLPVRINYAVFEALGGEKGYESSTKPLYRPPFFIQEAQSRFGLRGDRSTEFLPGQMLRLGSHCFYIKALTYFPSRIVDGVEKGDVTSVDIFPSTVIEVGSRAPGNDIVTVITASPITSSVDVDGPAPVATSADAGFMSVIDTAVFPFEPVARGQATVTFLGDMTLFAVPGHILEVGGQPFTIGKVEQNEDGTRTKITVAAPFLQSFNMQVPPTIKLSYRPVYPPDPREFLGVGPLLDTENFDLILFGEKDANGATKPGRVLVQSIEYDIEPNTGALKLLSPNQKPLGPGERLLLQYTRLRQLSPFLQDGVVTVPRYHADYLFNTLPTTQNGFLGGQVRATYSFHSPDTFYCRAVPMKAFLGEAIQEAVDEITSKQPASGAIKTPAGGSENWEVGRFGLRSERRHLLDKDRSARVLLDFYNTCIVTFEQVVEAIEGGFVGDRDGKFRFWIGRGKALAPPGYEDEISGLLNPRHIWNEVFNGERLTGAVVPLILDADDFIVDPDTATVNADGSVDGDFPDADLLDKLIFRQRGSIRNDIDDVVLTSVRTVLRLKLSFPFFELRALGTYAKMRDPSFLSRLFPGLTRAFFTTYPGVGSDVNSTPPDVGAYTFARVFGGNEGEAVSSTFLRTIAKLQNPVLGEIRNISDAALTKRQARSRIWGYFPEGLKAGSMGAGTPAIPEPCVIAVPLLLRDLPIDPITGFPDPAQLITGGGTLLDANTGDFNLVFPGFVVGDQIAWGKPNGDAHQAYHLNGISVFGTQGLSGLFVAQVQFGCVLTFKDQAGDGGSTITDPTKILIGTGPDSGRPAHEGVTALEQGDTIFATAGVAVDDTDEPSDPPTLDDMAKSVGAMDTYRDGFDLIVKGDGRIWDMSLPSFKDPFFFGLKEILGQNSADPMTHMEGRVEFAYTASAPLRVPALNGQTRDDAGDFQIPYLRTGNTELDRFDEAAIAIGRIMAAVDVPTGLSVYPDEIIASDGEIVGAVAAGFGTGQKEPATLLTVTQDVRPIFNGSTDLGIGDVRSHDLLLMEATNPGGIDNGSLGILTIGEVETRNVPNPASLIEPPRFVTQTSPPIAGGGNATGSPVSYQFTRAITFLDTSWPADPQAGLPPPGVEIIEDTVAGVTVLNFASVPNPLALNDGFAAGAGNFNDIWGAGLPKSNNNIVFHIYFRRDLNIVNAPVAVPGEATDFLTITLQGSNVTVAFNGGPNVGVLGGAAVFGTTHPAPIIPVLANLHIVLPVVGLIPWGPGAGTRAQWFIPHTLAAGVFTSLYGYEFSIDVDTFNTGANTGESTTAWISPNRLTFNEVFDLRHAGRRSLTHPRNGATSLEAGLQVREVTFLDGAVDPPAAARSAINSSAVNGGLDLTFLARSVVLDAGTPVPADMAGGHWTPRTGAPTPEHGRIKVMAWEGDNNFPVLGSGIRFAAVPSNHRGEPGDPVPPDSVICQGNAVADVGFPNRLTSRLYAVGPDLFLTATAGAIDNILPGDICVVQQSTSAVHLATVQAGTYLVRHAVEATGATLYREASPVASLGGGTGWINQAFPRVVSINTTTNVLTVEGADPTTNFPGAGRVYVILDAGKLDDADVAVFRNSLVSFTYTGLTATTFTGLGGFLFADGTVPTAAQVNSLVQAGQRVSGMESLTLSVKGAGLPLNNSVVGLHDPLAAVPADRTWYGFHSVEFNNPFTSVILRYQGQGGDFADGVPGPEALGFSAAAVISDIAFNATQDSVVYGNVPGTMFLNIPAGDFTTLNDPVGHGGDVNCLIPGTLATPFDTAGGGNAGFRAQAGIYFEPSFPLPNQDLAGVNLRVVDATNSAAPGETGMRGGIQQVDFEIRRIRRFHGVLETADSNFTPLRFAYEIRRGRITAYTQDAVGKQSFTVGATNFVFDWESTKPAGAPKAPDVWDDGLTYTGTNLGAFNNTDVNINAGDQFRLLDSTGVLVDEIEIAAADEAGNLRLKAPGLTATPDGGTYVGMRFEVFLRRALAPHEQSNEQLLDLLTTREVTRTDADWANFLGGHVLDSATWANAVNRLYDDLNADGVGGANFTALGVQKGDILIVDPLGKIPVVGGLPTVQETSTRPVGDLGVLGRVDASAAPVHTPGQPNPLDDNRGFYRVKRVVDDDPSGPHLLVDEISTFAGAAATHVTFPAAPDITRDYAIYPTITNSTLAPGNVEGQMDLRPTAHRDGTGRYGLTDYSVRPFSYRIIRPSKLFSDTALDLILTMRERMLSWIELLRTPMSGRKSGSYFIFQRDEHILDIGSPADGDDGLGVYPNSLIESIVGRTGVVPFSNASDCLSILDRRFWILDQRLDQLTAVNNVSSRLTGPGDTAYTAYTDTVGGGAAVRPVLRDRIDGVLNRGDRFRDLRFAWLEYRAHRLLGTLASILRFDEDLPERQAEQKRLLLLRESSEKVD